MLFHSLRALGKAPWGAASIWKYLEALARATGVPGRCAYGFRSELHFPDGRSSCQLYDVNFFQHEHLGQQKGVSPGILHNLEAVEYTR